MNVTKIQSITVKTVEDGEVRDQPYSAADASTASSASPSRSATGTSVASSCADLF